LGEHAPARRHRGELVGVADQHRLHRRGGGRREQLVQLTGADHPGLIDHHQRMHRQVQIERILAFRDWPRTHDEDRANYERTKRELAQHNWRYLQHYANAKSDVVEEILTRALRGRVGRACSTARFPAIRRSRNSASTS
jgi:GrpB-like predicted nucleotidyltransferase (UPF0157 family)